MDEGLYSLIRFLAKSGCRAGRLDALLDIEIAVCSTKRKAVKLKADKIQ